MFDRFTEGARQVVVLAQEEAGTLKHNYIGTEHILLGLLREHDGLAARVLGNLDVTVERVRAEVVRSVGWGEEPTSNQIPFTTRTKAVLELALREALSLGHNYIGTEHILLGLVRENAGIATRILLDSDADSEKIRNEVIRMLSGPGGRRRQRAGSGSGSPPSPRSEDPAEIPDAPPAEPRPRRVRRDVVAGASETGLQDTMSRMMRREDELYAELRELQADIDIVRNELSNRRKRADER